MSALRNSPYGKRLRASRHDEVDEDHDEPRRGRQRVNPIFGLGSLMPLSLPSEDDANSAAWSSSSSSSSTMPSRPTSTTPPLEASSGSGSGTSDSSGPDSPGDAAAKEKEKDYGDRFVPSRQGDMRTNYYLHPPGPSTPSKKNRIIPSESDALKEQANQLFSTILHTEVTPVSPSRSTSPVRSQAPIPAQPTTPNHRRLFAFNSPTGSAPSTPKRRLDTAADEAYSLSPVRAESRRLLESPRRKLRSVCKTPYRVLDAPELAEDFYLNLVDWSSTNVLGVGLGSCVYLWTAHNAAVSKLCDLAEEGDSISSVSWVQKGSTLAVGTLSGRLHVYDAASLRLLRTYQQAHSQRIGALAWNQHVLSSGSRDRMVYHRDVREAAQRPFKRCNGHRQEVCGLKWSTDGGPASANLASGGNDNKVCIWDLRGSRRPTSGSRTLPIAGSSGGGNSSGAAPANSDDPSAGDSPLFKFHEHTAAVKALAWDPHLSGVLATGGGTQDKHIRFWNTSNGTMISELDTGSQVCNLIWSLTSHELVSTHGFSSTTAQNQICIWKYPTLDMVASLTGHTNRVLYLAMSPDGETIVTGAGDETLRFWNAFPRRDRGGERGETRLDYGRLIR